MMLPGLAVAHSYDHVFIAPHLDDAALSCGGNVARLVGDGQRVLVVTICAGSPGAEQPHTQYIAYLHDAWNLGDDPIALRREEDIRALGHLGADGLHLGELDAVYREPAYGTRDGIFGVLVAHDPLIAAAATLLRALREQNPVAQIYLPLAVGGHVDHQAVWVARGVLGATPLVFYEDFPYAARPDAFTTRMAALDEPLVSTTVQVDDFLPRKIAAIAEYRSQQTELFADAAMEDVVRAYAAAVDGTGHFSERLWSTAS